MPVTIHLPSVLSRLAGGLSRIEASGATLGDVVEEVARRYPALGPRLRDDTGAPYPFVNFFVNDEDARFRGGFGAPLEDGDEIAIIPAIAGG